MSCIFVREFLVLQTTDIVPGSGLDLLSTAWRMVTPLPSPLPPSLILSYLAASRPASNSGSILSGWSWTDGTPSSNLACSDAGCSIFSAWEPKWVLLRETPALPVRSPAHVASHLLCQTVSNSLRIRPFFHSNDVPVVPDTTTPTLPSGRVATVANF